MASVAMTYQGSQPVCPQTSPLDFLGVCHRHSRPCGVLVFQKFPPRQLDPLRKSAEGNRGRACQKESQAPAHLRL